MTFDWGGLEERFTERKNAQPGKVSSPMVATTRNAAFSASVARVL
jgi:hypothetical protein